MASAVDGSKSVPLSSKVDGGPSNGPNDVDLELGSQSQLLAPSMTVAESALRWGFIQKVYGIIGAQLAITAAVGSVFALHSDVRYFAITNLWFQVLAFVLPLAMMVPLYIYRQKHPLNLGLLALWTVTLSPTVGLACSFYKGEVVAEALLVTGIVVLGLTSYTFYAVRKGVDFSFMGPMLFASLLALVAWGFIQLFFPFGQGWQFVFALIGALVFSLYIVYDTDSIIKRYSYDEFVWASVGLYLDIINLFLRLLEILDYLQGGR